jgi:hypothetical protein
MTPHRSLRTFAVSMLLAGSALAVPAAWAQDPGPCPLRRQADETVRQHMKELIRCAAHRWPVAGGAAKAICVAERESGLDPKATSPDGRFLGLYQHQRKYWRPRYEEWTKPAWQLSDSPFVGRTQAIVTMRMVNAGSWAPWKGAGC